MPKAPPIRRRVLILGGTYDAATLAYAVMQTFGDAVDVISSLAGRTRPPDLPGTVRIGGFGGADGLKAYLDSQNIDVLIDSTHPFAAQISRNAAAACAAANVERLSLIRPPWPLKPDGPWIEVPTIADAVDELRRLQVKRVFVSTGVTDLQAFASLPDVFFLVRLINGKPDGFPLENSFVVTGKPPFSKEQEMALIRNHQIEAMVTKNSGGDLNQGKIEAVTELHLPTLMIRRPDHPTGERVRTIEEAIVWLKTLPCFGGA